MMEKLNVKLSYKSISLLLIIVFTILSLFHERHIYYLKHDDAEAFAGVYKTYRPELYPHDKLVNIMQRGYITYYYKSIYLLSKVLDIKTAFLIFHIVSRVLFISSIFMLSMALFSKPEIGWLTMVLFLIPKDMYGYTPTISRDIQPQFFAVPMLIIALSFLFRNKVIVFAVIVSAILYIHSMTAIWSLLIGAFCWLGIKGYKAKLQSVCALIIGIIFSIPFLYLYINSGLSNSEGILDINQIESLARWRLDAHIFPSCMGVSSCILKLGVAFIIFVFGYFGVKNNKKLIRIYCYIFFGTLIIWTAGVVFSEIYYLPMMNKLQLLRSSTVELILLSTFLANFIWHAFSGFCNKNNYIAILFLILGVFYFSLNGIGYYQIIGISFIAVSFFVSHENINKTIDEIINKLIHIYKSEKLLKRIFIPFFLSFMVITTSWGLTRYCHNAGTIPASMKEAALWAKDNTPIDAIFVTRPNKESFRCWSQRSQIPDWKDGGIANYELGDYAKYFLEVMKAYEFYPGMDSSYLNNVLSEKVISVGVRFGADYAFLPREDHIVDNVVFMNDEWQIIKLGK